MSKNAFDSAWNWEHSYAELPERCYSLVKPTPVWQPGLYVFNDLLAGELNLEKLSTLDPELLVEVFAGNRVPGGAKPLAMAYAGHQFGNFVVLGDGRAILLGEHLDGSGRRHDIQLKGSGLTPYSRRGDGRAALGPMLREFLISEAMAALGIATTRSLAVVETGELVMRDGMLPGAVLVRTAVSHLRVGTFELFAAREDIESLKALLDHTIARHYPELADAQNPALALLRAVQESQAELVASWMAVGFVHGVLNTDNVALSGETIDYGPCAFIDRYHPGAVYSSIDRQGRYAYGNQPGITAWNLARFAESLLPLIDADSKKAVSLAEETLEVFPDAMAAAWLQRMVRKFGIEKPEPADRTLIEDWLALLDKHRLDFTNAFRALSGDENSEKSQLKQPDFVAWHQRLEARLKASGISPAAAQALRETSNPIHIPRNHAVEKALDTAVAGDPLPFQRALEVLRRPFDNSISDHTFSATPSEGEQVYTTFCGT
ncbi:MAG: YdiU family protein [Opitutales bacterium]|nr:YdiU family protein [Opitutales bacterium]